MSKPKKRAEKTAAKVKGSSRFTPEPGFVPTRLPDRSYPIDGNPRTLSEMARALRVLADRLETSDPAGGDRPQFFHLGLFTTERLHPTEFHAATRDRVTVSVEFIYPSGTTPPHA